MTRSPWLFALILAGCVSLPPGMDVADIDKTITPDQAAASIETVRGRDVLWGGAIVAGRNLKDRTELEVLGYPLDRSGRPDPDGTPLHRFIIVHPGYLETTDYRADRLLTVVGTVQAARAGKVGEAAYTFPVVDARRLHLWPIEAQTRSTEPRIQFGIGVIFH